MGDYDFMLQSYAVCAGLLWFFYTLTQFSAVDAKAHPPEDAQLMEKEIEKQNKAEADGDWDALRNKRVWINNQENLPLDVAVMTGVLVVSVAKATEEGNANTFGYLFIVYTIFRYAWFACYKFKLNSPVPLRSVTFFLTKISMVVMIIMLFVVVFDTDPADEERRLNL